MFLLLASSLSLWGQPDYGEVDGVVTDRTGRAVPGVVVWVQGVPPAFEPSTRAAEGGRFRFRLPYGRYRFSAGAASVWSRQWFYVEPAGVTCLRLTVEASEAITVPCPAAAISVRPGVLPGSDHWDAILLTTVLPTVTQPLNLTGLSAAALPLVSLRALSWTSTRFEFHGINATDPYQPGRPAIIPDASAIDALVVQDAAERTEPANYGSTVSVLLRSAPEQWRTTVSTSATGSALAAGNLPDPATRGLVRQSEYYQWYARPHIEAGGPLGRRASLFLSGTGQWASQTLPLAPPDAVLKTRLLMTSARLGIRISPKHRLDSYYTGALAKRSDHGLPAGIEPLLARRGGPSFSVHPDGFPGVPEHDRFYTLATAWSRTGAEGDFVARAGVSGARLETESAGAPGSPSYSDLLNGVTNGIGPLASTGDRTNLHLAADYRAPGARLGGSTHEFSFGGEWETAGIRNRLAASSGLNLITAAYAPAFVLSLNTPADTRYRTNHLRAWARDEIAVTSWLNANLAGVVDRAGGGPFAWINFSPRAALAVTPGGFRRVVFRASYARLQPPLAARYLDYGNPASLGGTQYRWTDLNGDRLYQPGERGPAVHVFGGPYSSIHPGVKRPYADEINVAAESRLPLNIFGRMRLFRRDEKNRLAAVNTGVPFQAYRPVEIADPGPDGRPGTFDDAAITVYAQDPSTLGADRYVLTNPAGLRTLDAGLIAELSTGRGAWRFHSSFMAVKSYGPTSPGNLPLQNDPGVIGSLYSDPNASINATGRAFFDRAYVGKVQLVGTLPRFLGGLEWANTVTYMDGLPFARLMLVTGMPQGPFWVQAGVHGSPGGGNRAEYVMNWNLRLSKTFTRSDRLFRAGADAFNVAGSGNRIQEIDISGTGFNKRLPVAIQPAPSVQLFFEYRF